MLKRACKTIDNCEDCPHFFEVAYQCLKMENKRMAGENGIPDWCPLETVGGVDEEDR